MGDSDAPPTVSHRVSHRVSHAICIITLRFVIFLEYCVLRHKRIVIWCGGGKVNAIHPQQHGCMASGCIIPVWMTNPAIVGLKALRGVASIPYSHDSDSSFKNFIGGHPLTIHRRMVIRSTPILWATWRGWIPASCRESSASPT